MIKRIQEVSFADYNLLILKEQQLDENQQNYHPYQNAENSHIT
jgi:hypothetical protein